MPRIVRQFYLLLALGIFSLIINTVLFCLWKVLSVSIANRCREMYLRSFLRQDTVWVEQHNLFDLAARFKENCLNVQKSIGDKVALYSNFVGMMGSCMATAFCVRWTYALVLLCTLPLSGLIVNSFLDILIKKREYEVKYYRRAEAKAEEAFSLIKTVKAFNAEDFELRKYEKEL